MCCIYLEEWYNVFVTGFYYFYTGNLSVFFGYKLWVYYGFVCLILSCPVKLACTFWCLLSAYVNSALWVEHYRKKLFTTFDMFSKSSHYLSVLPPVHILYKFKSKTWRDLIWAVAEMPAWLSLLAWQWWICAEASSLWDFELRLCQTCIVKKFDGSICAETEN